jgi:hypothetical protein
LRTILIVVLLAASLGACARSEPDAPPWDSFPSVLVEKGHSSTAPRASHHLDRLGAQNFEFLYNDWYDRLDTRAGTITRILPAAEGGPRTVKLRLTAAERDTLYGLLADARYFESPRKVGHGSKGVSSETVPTDFEVVVDSVSKSVHWEPTIPELVPQMARRNPRPLDPEEPGLFEFRQRLKAMLRRRDAYVRLPRGLPTH